MKKERIKQSLLALALAGVLLVPAVPLGASAFDAGLDQGAEFNLSLGNTGTADTGSTGSQDVTPDGGIAPQGSTTAAPVRVQAAGTHNENIYAQNGVLRIYTNVTVTLNTTTGGLDVTDSNGNTYSVPGNVLNTSDVEENVNSIYINKSSSSANSPTMTLKMDDESKVWNRACGTIDVGPRAGVQVEGALHIKADGDAFMTMLGCVPTNATIRTEIYNATIVNDGSAPIIYAGESGTSRGLKLSNVNLSSKGPALKLYYGNATGYAPTITIEGGTFTGNPAILCGYRKGTYNVNITNATLDGSSGNYGIEVHTSVNVNLSNTTIKNCTYAIYENADTTDLKTNVTINNCTIRENVTNMAYMANASNSYATLTMNGSNNVATNMDILFASNAKAGSNLQIATSVKKADGTPWTIGFQNNVWCYIGMKNTLSTDCVAAISPNWIITGNGTGDSVYAGPHDHEWIFDTSGNTITAKCSKTLDGVACVYGSPQTLTATVEKSHIYDGKAVSATVSGEDAMTAAGLTVTTKYYKGNTELSAAPSEIGSYAAKVTVASGDQSSTLEIPFAIVAPIEGVQNLVYNGKAQTLVQSGTLPAGVKVLYKQSNGSYSEAVPTGTNAGEYTVEYYLTEGSSAIYGTAAAPITLKVTIAKAQGTITFDPNTLAFVYDGQNHRPTHTVTPGYRTTTTTLRKGGVGAQNAIDAGTYTLDVSCSNNQNYADCSNSATFTITPKEIGIGWDVPEFTYDGTSHIPTATATGLIEQDTCSITVTGAGTNAGNYTATATGVSNSNYKLPAEGTTQPFTIAKFTPTDIQITGAIKDSLDLTKVTFTHTVKGPGDSTVTGTVKAKDDQTLTWGEDGKCVITCVFTPTDTTNIASVEVENVTVQLQDTEMPKVTYTLNGENWITEQYLNKDAQVTVTVTDAVSGLKSGEYAIWWDGQSSLEWKPIQESGQVTVTVPAEHGRFFQIRVRAEDKAGNGAGGDWCSVACNFITQPPVIDLDANKTYYVTTKFSVSGMEITSVTRKNSTSGVTDTIGSTAGDNFLLPGNTDTTYTVTATDKAGNVTTVTVTMKPIASIMDPLKGVTVNNVTTDNEQTVQERIFLVTKLVGTPDIPTNEYNSLYNVLSGQLEPLLDRISQVRNLYNNALKYASITPDTVTKDDLDKILVAGGIETIIDDFVRDYSGNLTGDQKAKLAEIKQNLKAAQDLLKQVSDLEAEINALPNSVEPDDVDAVTRVRDLRSARASLSDHAQELIDGMCNAKLDALWAQATAYKIIKGDGKVWMRSEGDYEVVANGPFDWFTQLLIDGETVEPDSYTAASGSTVVTLPKAYMDDLKDGKHTIVFVYENDGPLGQAEGSFTVQTPASGSPRTGDENNMLPYGIAIVAALAALAVLFVPKKRKKQ